MTLAIDIVREADREWAALDCPKTKSGECVDLACRDCVYAGGYENCRPEGNGREMGFRCHYDTSPIMKRAMRLWHALMREHRRYRFMFIKT